MDKIDHHLSENDVLSGRFSFNKSSNDLLGGRFGIPPPGCTNCGGSGRTRAKVYSSMLRWNHTFGANMLNELQVSNHRSPKSSGTQGDNEPWPDTLGLPNPFGVTGWPTICGPAPFLYRRWGCWDGDNRKDENLTACAPSRGQLLLTSGSRNLSSDRRACARPSSRQSFALALRNGA